MVGCFALAWRARPAGFLRNPEDAVGPVFVRVLRVGSLVLLGDELGVLLLEGVGDVFEEDEAEDDVLVLGGVHVVAELVGGQPELRLESEGGSVAVRLLAVVCFCSCHVFPGNCRVTACGYHAVSVSASIWLTYHKAWGCLGAGSTKRVGCVCRRP